MFVFFLLFQSVLVQSFRALSGGSIQILLFSFLLTGLLTSIILSFLPSPAINHLTYFTQVVFLSDLGKFLWLVLPVLALAFLGRSHNEY